MKGETKEAIALLSRRQKAFEASIRACIAADLESRDKDKETLRWALQLAWRLMREKEYIFKLIGHDEIYRRLREANQFMAQPIKHHQL